MLHQTVASCAALVSGEVIGNGSALVLGLADLQSAGPQHLSFLTHRRYIPQFQQTKAIAVLVAEPQEHAPCNLIVCRDPYLAMAHLANHFYPPRKHLPGIHPGAHVAADAHLEEDVCVYPGAVIASGARIGKSSVVGANCYIGDNVLVGENCLLHPGVHVLFDCKLGNRVILHPGVVVGADGFGFAVDKTNGQRHKIPQIGNVVIGDDVEIGANTTIDRATFGSTSIGNRTKIDNLVQIAHNVAVGCDCVIVSQTGIAGSTVIDDRVIIGAQGGIAGHLTITHDVILGARTGVGGDIDKSGIYSGSPHMPHRQWLRVAMSQKEIPNLRYLVHGLKKQVEILSANQKG